MADSKVRPDVPVVHADPVEHRRRLAIRVNASLTRDGTNGMDAPLQLKIFAKADLPDASLWEGALVHVSDETGGAVPMYSDGSNWLRLEDQHNGGKEIQSGDASTKVFTIAHGLADTPSEVSVEPSGADSAGTFWISNVDATNIELTYSSAPASGTDNIHWRWMARL